MVRLCRYKKAQLAASLLHDRFHLEDARFAFRDIDELTIFSDNVIPGQYVSFNNGWDVVRC